MRPLVARRIEEIREQKKLSRTQLAEKLSTTRIQIWRWETGTTRVSAELAARVAEALGVTIAALYREARS